jgi:hypothetical protein
MTLCVNKERIISAGKLVKACLILIKRFKLVFSFENGHMSSIFAGISVIFGCLTVE